MDAIMHRHKPIFRIHQNEKYFPCSIDFLLSHCKSKRPYVALGALNSENVVRVEGLRDLELDKEAWGGQRQISHVPIYCTYWFEERRRMFLRYYVFFGRRSTWCGLWGQDADLKSITIELNAATLEPIIDPWQVWAGSHPVICIAPRTHEFGFQGEGCGAGCGRGGFDAGNENWSDWYPAKVCNLEGAKWNLFVGKIGSIHTPALSPKWHALD